SCDVDIMTFGSSTPAQRYSSSSAERIPIDKKQSTKIDNRLFN
ncbi:unnamed protein product, partial [Rotaria socialis]